MTRQLHYYGFIDACASCGLEKEAADALYKKAGLTGRALGYLFGKGDVITRVPFRVGGGVIRGTYWLGRKAIPPALRGTWSAVKYLGSGVKDFGTDFARAYTAASGGSSIPKIVAKTLGGLGSVVTSPVSTAYNFIKKHPIISTVGGIGLGAYMGNPVDLEDRESVNRMHMRTLTPSEKIMFDRQANGLGLPGLGLDPMYFKSSDPNSVLQHLRY